MPQAFADNLRSEASKTIIVGGGLVNYLKIKEHVVFHRILIMLKSC